MPLRAIAQETLLRLKKDSVRASAHVAFQAGGQERRLFRVFNRLALESTNSTVNMDIVLELTDTFVADYAYAYLFPARTALYDYPNAAANVSAAALSSWTYKPATEFLRVEPSLAAYMSSLDRDHPVRQIMTLFFITWFVVLAACISRVLTCFIPGSLDCWSTSSLRRSPSISSLTSAP